jgi:hypothetical protein
MEIIRKAIKTIIQRIGFLLCEKFINVNLWYKYNEIMEVRLSCAENHCF